MGEVGNPILRHSEGKNLYRNTFILTWYVHKTVTDVTGKEAFRKELLKHRQLAGP